MYVIQRISMFIRVINWTGCPVAKRIRVLQAPIPFFIMSPREILSTLGWFNTCPGQRATVWNFLVTIKKIARQVTYLRIFVWVHRLCPLLPGRHSLIRIIRIHYQENEVDSWVKETIGDVFLIRTLLNLICSETRLSTTPAVKFS